MLVFMVSLVLTAMLITKLGHRASFRPSDLGSMSTSWLAAHRAAQHASSL